MHIFSAYEWTGLDEYGMQTQETIQKPNFPISSVFRFSWQLLFRLWSSQVWHHDVLWTDTSVQRSMLSPSSGLKCVGWGTDPAIQAGCKELGHSDSWEGVRKWSKICTNGINRQKKVILFRGISRVSSLDRRDSPIVPIEPHHSTFPSQHMQAHVTTFLLQPVYIPNLIPHSTHFKPDDGESMFLPHDIHKEAWCHKSEDHNSNTLYCSQFLVHPIILLYHML
jgi:hypothetical protein